MRRIYLTILLSINSIFASDFALQNLSIRNGSFQFENNQGEIRSDTFAAELKGMKLQMANGEIGLGLNENSFDISYQDILGSFETEEQSLFNTLGSLSMTGLQLDLMTQEKILLNIADLSIEVGDGMQQLNDTRLLCRKSARKSNLDMILPCLEDGAMSIKKIEVAKESEDSVSKAVSNKSLSVGSLDNFYIKIDNGAFKAQLYTTIIFRLKVTMKGSVRFNKAKNEFSLEIAEAKAGWLNVRSKLIDAIKGAGLEGLRVEGNTIYFTL